MREAFAARHAIPTQHPRSLPDRGGPLNMAAVRMFVPQAVDEAEAR
ncbi:MAG: hypothetical protein JNK45_14540 [Myxococcales bacterium]|nr:hypothetical protein [Myxococcales bacterium]